MNIVFVELEMERSWSVASIGPAFLAAVAREMGHNCQLITAPVEEGHEDTLAQIIAAKPDILGLSLTTRQWLRARSIIAAFEEQNTDCLVITGGLHPTFSPEEVLQAPGIDAVCLGEGELAFRELLLACEAQNGELRQLDRYPALKNIWLRGRPRPAMHPPAEIDNLPWMERDLLNERYGVIYMTTQRGCPFPCTYCAARMYNQLYGSQQYGRRRSLEDVFAEIEHIRANGPLNYIVFLDDTFTINPKWVRQFCQEYPKRFSIKFSLHARAETVHPKLLHDLAAAGCAHITFGVESGSERIRRDIMKRKVSNQRLLDCFEASRAAGILTTANYMLGIPTETVSDIEETIALHHQLQPDDFGHFIFYPYPGTPMYKYCLDRGLLPNNFSELPANHSRSILMLNSITPEQIQAAYQRFTDIRKAEHLARLRQHSAVTQQSADTVDELIQDCADAG